MSAKIQQLFELVKHMPCFFHNKKGKTLLEICLCITFECTSRGLLPVGRQELDYISTGDDFVARCNKYPVFNRLSGGNIDDLLVTLQVGILIHFA